MTLRNDPRLGVRNGNRGVVLDVDTDERTMRVQLPNRVVGYVHLSRLEPLEVDLAGAFEPLYYDKDHPNGSPILYVYNWDLASGAMVRAED